VSWLLNRDAYRTTARRLAFTGAFLLGLSVPLLADNLRGWAPSAIRREIERVTSPDGRQDAVLTEEHAKIVFGRSLSQVHLVRHGTRAEDGSLVFSADSLANPQLVWTDPHLLEIRYGRARVHYFTNDMSDSPVGKDWPVEIRLVPLSADFSWLLGTLNPKGLAEPPSQ